MEETMGNLVSREIDRLKALRLKRLSCSGETAETPAYKCRKCRDTGYYEIEKDGYTFAHECECGRVQRERLAGRLKFAAVPKEFEGLTVDNFRTDCYVAAHSRELAEMAKQIAAEYVRQFREIRESGKGLYFHSGVKGSGKTRLAVSIANDLFMKQEVLVKFATTLQILDQIKKTWDKKPAGYDKIEQASEQKLIEDIISAPVLVVDDIGVEQPKDWVNERFYNIINGRMIEKRITIFTSNCRMEELGLEDRIVSRIEKMAMPIEFPAESVRRAIARKENDDLMGRLLGK